MTPLTVVLVPGAFHHPSTMDIFSAQLQQKGYTTRTWGLKTVNKPNVSVEEDSILLAEGLLKPLVLENGEDVVLYLHSYAGFPGSTAIAGLSKAERSAKGLRGGILGLIYQSAFVPKEGNTLLQMIGGKYAPWQDPDENTGLTKVIDPKNTFFADVHEPLASEATNWIHSHSLLAFNSPPPGPVHYPDAAYDGRRVYLHTTQDQALPPFAQDAFVSQSGVDWKLLKLETSHAPFLSVPDRLADIVEEEIHRFAASFEATEGAQDPVTV